jgi:hypothetical protein
MHALYRDVFAATGVAAPRIAYIGAANGDDDDFFEGARDAFVSCGSGAVERVRCNGRNRER